MVKVNPSLTLELKGGQTITIDLQEARQLVKSLAKFIQGNGRAKNITPPTSVKQKKKGRKNSGRKSHRRSLAGMSDAKQKSMLDHVSKRLSSDPQTLSYLLKGISYSPNHLPMIRRLVENQPHVAKQVIGKRTYYSAKRAGKVAGSSKVTAAAAA
jgi:hypothetical protein